MERIFKMKFNLLTKELVLFGFTENDIKLLNQILTSKYLEDEVELISIPGQLFDFGYFVRTLIENQQFRGKIVKVLHNEIDDYPNSLLNQMTFDPNSIHFKLNLLLLIIGTIRGDKVDSLYHQFLVLDKNNVKKHNTLIDAFFEMVRDNELGLNRVFNLLSTSSELERSGWVMTMTDLPHKESIAEHMYNMYLLGLLYLPEKLENVDYHKDDVLQMVLLHDLAETITGDIPHPNKTREHEIDEDLKAKAIFCKLMYNGVSNAGKLYDLWCDWSSNLSINAKIAHDLDAIQLNYQFLKYAHQENSVFSDQDIINWTKRQPKTMVGKSIYKKVILENEIFKERIGVISEKFSDYGTNCNS